MPLADLANDRIEVQTEYRDLERMKLVPGAKWDSAGQTWALPLSWAGCVQLRAIFGSDLQVGTALGAWARNERETRINPCLELRGLQALPHDHPFSRKLDELAL